jgi:hypothetical protein
MSISKILTKSGANFDAVSTAPVRIIWNGAATSGSHSEILLAPTAAGVFGVVPTEVCPPALSLGAVLGGDGLDLGGDGGFDVGVDFEGDGFDFGEGPGFAFGNLGAVLGVPDFDDGHFGHLGRSDRVILALRSLLHP